MIASAGLTGRHVLWAMIGFFGVVFAVNGVFLYVALSTWNGTDVDNAYIKGLAYNEVLAAARAQRDLEWSVVVENLEGQSDDTRLEVRYEDDRGAPIVGLSVEALFRHPVRRANDRVVTLSEGEGGLYGAAVSLPGAGEWDVHVVASGDGETRHVLRYRATIQ
jgi:nitrogen fixation protein FixH